MYIKILDLHVLSILQAFAQSQDQTQQLKLKHSDRFQNPLLNYIYLKLYATRWLDRKRTQNSRKISIKTQIFFGNYTSRLYIQPVYENVLKIPTPTKATTQNIPTTSNF